MGTRTGAFFKKRFATAIASLGSVGLSPQDSHQKFLLETSLQIPKIGRLVRISSCWREDDRQLGKPEPIGMPSRRMERRSGGKLKPKEDSMEENSESDRPSRTSMLQDLR